MIDTIQITMPLLDKKEFNKVYQILEAYCKKSRIASKDILHKDKETSNKHFTKYVTSIKSSVGFREISLCKYKNNEYPRYGITILLQPKLLLEQNDFHSVMHWSEIQSVAEKFDKVIKKVFLDCELPTFYLWQCNRIDYTINIHLSNSNEVENYIKLFQRAYIPSRFLELYLEGANRRGQRKGSFYIFIKNYVHLNFYDKDDQLVNNASRKNQALGFIGQNILRIEIQCFSKKVNNIKNKYKYQNKILAHFLNPDIAEYIIKYYYKNTIGSGDFYTIKKAVSLIQKSKKKNSTRLKLIEILFEIKSKRGVYNFLHKYDGSHKKAKKLISHLHELGINPVTIPDSWGVKDDYMLNPLKEIDQYFSNSSQISVLTDTSKNELKSTDSLFKKADVKIFDGDLDEFTNQCT